jgi:hypothetical protein
MMQKANVSLGEKTAVTLEGMDYLEFSAKRRWFIEDSHLRQCQPDEEIKEKTMGM